MNISIILILSLHLCHRSMAKKWTLVWSPEANKDGLKAFEGVEDLQQVHRTTHIFVEDNNYRFNMHTKDRDSNLDRQRQEVKGMVSNGHQMRMLKGETWKFTYSMLIPSSLKATSSFTHIAQMKMPKAVVPDEKSPIYVMSLRRHGNKETIEAKIFNNSQMLGSTNLKPLQDKWIDVELEYHVDDVHGSAKWTLISNNKIVVQGEKKNVKTFFHESVRPKWGIYRSLSDSKQLFDTHLLITKLRAYKLE